MKDRLFGKLKPIILAIQELSRRAVKEYTPQVNAVISEEITDPMCIEHLLDGMLDFCFNEDMLNLYKKLCRYYYYINPAGTISYVNAYRELWDNDGDEISPNSTTLPE